MSPVSFQSVDCGIKPAALFLKLSDDIVDVHA